MSRLSLIWSPSALRDVQRLYRFLAEKNKDVARRAVQAIRSGVLIIGQHPEVGRPSEEMGPEYREWLINFGNSGYVALYHYDGEVLSFSLFHRKLTTLKHVKFSTFI